MDWDHLYSNFKKFANRTADKLSRTADIATLQVKLSMADKKLEEAYAALGRISYEHFTSDADLSERVAAGVSAVNDALIEKKAIESEIREAKKAAEAAKAAEEAERAAAEQAEASAATSPKKPASTTAPAPTAPAETMNPPITAISDGADSIEIAIEEE